MNDIKEKSILEQFIKVNEFFMVDEIIKEYSKTHLQKLRVGIHKETIQLIKMHNKDRIHTILHFLTNLIYFVILSGYFILGNEKLVILSSSYLHFKPLSYIITLFILLNTSIYLLIL